VFKSLKEGKDTIADVQTGAGGDVLDIHELLVKGEALRVNGDRMSLPGDWTQIDPKNAPDDCNVFACHTATGNAHVLVQADVAVPVAAAV